MQTTTQPDCKFKILKLEERIAPTVAPALLGYEDQPATKAVETTTAHPTASRVTKVSPGITAAEQQKS